jgi:hypothetical protein
MHRERLLVKKYLAGVAVAVCVGIFAGGNLNTVSIFSHEATQGIAGTNVAYNEPIGPLVILAYDEPIGPHIIVAYNEPIGPHILVAYDEPIGPLGIYNASV